MEPLYAPQGVEERWQRAWDEEGLFRARADAPGDPYVIAVPPPNVTGALHMGHALNGTIQDVLVRWHRMRGFNTLWQPGYDHAGIATQNVVEKELAKQGKTRHDLGREAFVERVWEWLEEYGKVIIGQFRSLGASLDYERERFTKDEGYSRAVLAFLVRLHQRGWLYRDSRIVNWCPRCATAISDLEVVHEHVVDNLTSIRYPLADGSGSVTIATVRVPTILADVAVAVNPDDPRYGALVGRTAIVPIANREVPIIADPRVEIEFGTGALKITPGHDPLDFEIGREHGLPELTVIGFDGLMSDEAGALAGRSQEDADREIVRQLEEQGLLAAREPYEHAVGLCERCGTRIEPLISLQWFCDMEDLARPAIEVVEQGRVRFHPAQQGEVYLHWMRNIRPWCVSRQLWWGHRIPVWYCDCGEAIVSVDRPASCGACGASELRQDEDVLDTWFSSALWPFATLGWPDDTADLRRFYPGHVNSTAREIIFLWVARMIMSGLELVGDVPFEDVIIHSTVLAPDGRRMSKSLGTGIDPLEVIAAHGADATRYGLCKISSTQDVRFSYGAIEEGRKLANKLWNVSRLILSYAGDAAPDLRPQALEERWIVSRLASAQRELETGLAAYDFAEVARLLYHLTFDDVCDWYAEAVKPRLREGDADALATSLGVLERLLTLLHPVMPHVTEEIWSNLPGRGGRLIVADWPTLDEGSVDECAEAVLARVQELATLYRRSGALPALDDLDPDAQRILRTVLRLDRPAKDGKERGPDAAALEKERARLDKEIARAEAMLANERFVSRAPAELVQAERDKLDRFRRERDALR
ncbi:MAG: valine--tRNA ligase [Thermoleophilia bacterium]